MLAAHIAKPNPPAQGEVLAAGISDGVAQSGVPQQLGMPEALPPVQRDPGFLDGGNRHHEIPGHLARRPHELEPGPHPHGLRGVGGRLLDRLVLYLNRIRGSQSPVFPLVNLDAVGVRNHQARIGLALAGELLPGHLDGLRQRHLRHIQGTCTTTCTRVASGSTGPFAFPGLQKA